MREENRSYRGGSPSELVWLRATKHVGVCVCVCVCVCAYPHAIQKCTLLPSRVSQEKPLDVLAILFQRKFRNGQKLVDSVERDVPDW